MSFHSYKSNMARILNDLPRWLVIVSIFDIYKGLYLLSLIYCVKIIFTCSRIINLHWEFLAFTVTLIAAKTCTCGRQLKLFYFNCHVFKCIHVHVLFYLQGSEVIILLWNHTLKIEHPHMIPILSHPSQSSSCYLYISLCQVKIL